MVSGAVSDNVVVCIFCNIYVWRAWWELMGKDLDNIICFIYLSRIYLSYLANFRVGLAMTQEQPHGVKWWQITLERAKEMAGWFFTIILDPMLRLKILGQAIPPRIPRST